MILGIDLSLTSTGAVLLEILKDTFKIKAVENIKTTPDMFWLDRINNIVEGIEHLLQVSGCGIIYMENYSFGSKFNREVVAEVGGVVKWRLGKGYGVVPFLVPPNTIKKFVTGRGRAPKRPEGETKTGWGKRWAMRKVEEEFDLKFNTHDETDAFMVGYVGYCVERSKKDDEFYNSLNDYQKEVVQKLIKER